MWLRANPKVYGFQLPYLPYTKRWNTLRNMKLIIPEEHYEATKKRYKKESWSDFLTFVPIAMVVVLLLGYLNDQYPIILMPIIFVFTLIAFRIRGLIWINFHARILNRHYSLELDENLLTQRQGRIRKQIDLRQSTSHLNRFGVLIVNDKPYTFLSRILERRRLQIPPELDQFEKVRKIVESKTCANII